MCNGEKMEKEVTEKTENKGEKNDKIYNLWPNTHTYTEMERKTCTKMNFDQSIDHQVG